MGTPPLAERMRPRNLDEVVGQESWLGAEGPLRAALEGGRVPSMVLWGPPGCGKTTIARALTEAVSARFVSLSAVLDGIKQLREVVQSAKQHRALDPRDTVLFVDEIHRWNKSQQDALLPHVEDGTLILVGATTENPSFSLNAALRSRLRIISLEPLPTDEVHGLLVTALESDRGLDRADLECESGVLLAIARAAAGDARRALSDLETATLTLPSGKALTLAHVQHAVRRSDIRHDRAGDDHYDVVSALIKSMRGSDPDAALYWLARMVAVGEDPRFIARRLVIFAAEDVGNADPRALAIATDAAQAVQFIGMPEGRIPLAQAVTWLACAPKSNAAYKAIDAALADVRSHGALPIPHHLRNRPTEVPGREDSSYLYPHDFQHRIVKQQYLPDALSSRSYYEPASHGEERTIRERLAWWRRKLEED